jgi:hypothetical protein
VESTYFPCHSGRPGGAWANGEGRKDIVDRQWHQIVATYDGRQAALYIGGVPDASCQAWGRICANDHPVCIHDNAQQTRRYWNGLTDEVRIYSCALSEAKVADLYAARQGACSESSR